MKSLITLLILFTLLLISRPVMGQDATADLFKIKCGICHTIGAGKLVGPDLAGVNDRRSEEWFTEFVRSSQTMVNSGDPDAVALFEENNKVIMPDPMISDAEIKSIYLYISDNSGGAAAQAAPESIIADATAEDLANGKELFEGRIRFVNGGPACISCHNGLSDVFFSENSYAKDLAGSYVNLGEAGTKVILESSPFPVMNKAFEGRKLTEKEVHDLLVFLSNAPPATDALATASLPSGFLLYGVLGALVLLVLYSGFWAGRKIKSVNHNIYKRQIKSSN